uniref:Serine/threonine protein kinase n=1 Tax=Eiseniibacteriota bacterium TaxID=2212470 RepID=A0A832I5K1_UNCEI
MAAMKKDFGAFELHEKIGSGGMASVYLGVQKSLDRKVVLKILYPHLAEDEKLVQRFEREARAAAMLRHPNIVQVIDCGRHEDVAYIAMEFVEGLDLKKWMEQFGTPPIEIALQLISDMCAGIEHAHEARIVHRDIKPANIMLTPGGIVKIMDFGLARKGEDSTQMTVAGSVMGTPAYMSPEQATGEAVDERSDIFSAGVVAYELLGGQRPFQGDSYSTVLRAILTVEPPSLAAFNPRARGGGGDRAKDAAEGRLEALRAHGPGAPGPRERVRGDGAHPRSRSAARIRAGPDGRGGDAAQEAPVAPPRPGRVLRDHGARQD